MKILTKVHKILRRRGTIDNTDVSLHLHTDSVIEVRIRHKYTPTKKKPDTLYQIFKQCMNELENNND